MLSAPPFGPEHDALRAECRAFVEAELLPHAPAWEAAGAFPDDLFGLLARHGYLGLKYEPEPLTTYERKTAQKVHRGPAPFASGRG